MSKVRLADFPRTFWVANVMELFERAAYYGLMSVLAVYLRDALGFKEQWVGFLQAIVYAMVYVVPILGGALADRYGYRRMLLVAFSLLAAGYFAAGFTSSYALVFLCLLLMAVGAGLFKPIISATIARTTDERTSAIGFGIYYWMINVGAFVAPWIVSWLKGFSWQAVFTVSAAYCAAMLIPAAFLYRDPPRPENRKTLRDVLVGAAEVLGDARFMLMIVVYSGFWVLYFQQFSTVLWYLRDFVDREPVNRAVNGLLATLHIPGTFAFDAEHVTVINAATIILLQVVVSWIVKDRAALPTMGTGMALGAVGLSLLAVSRSPWFFIAGMVVFSIGEVTAHPKYYSFIGLVAPPDRKAVYMGYAFLYGVFGALIGSSLGGLLYQRLLAPAGKADPAASTFSFWMLFVALDVVATIGLFIVAHRFTADTAATRRGASTAMIVVYLLLAGLGVLFLVFALSGETVDVKTAVQAGIFVAIGLGGLSVVVRGRRKAAEVPAA